MDDADFTSREKTPEKVVCVETNELQGVSFICGSIFALRRELWEEVGGFSGHDKNVHEDTYLSNIIMGAGYQLKTLPRLFRNMRVFSREVLCRRYWKLGRSPGCVEAVIESGKSLPFTQKDFIGAVKSRCASIEKYELTLVFYYYEMLIMCHTFMEFCNALGTQGKLPKEAGKELLAGIWEELAPFPKLRLLLKSDFLKLRILPQPEYLAPAARDASDLATACDWSEVRGVLTCLREKYILAYLENEGTALILQDDRETAADYSSY